MSVQVCEGIWWSRCGQRVAVTQCDLVDGQRWTDGTHRYSDDGSFCGDRESPNDLVSFVLPLPDKSQPDQSAEIDRLRAECTDAIEQLQAKWQSEFTASQQLRSDNERLQAEALQAQRYVSDVNEKINQQSTEINRLNRNVEEFERINEHKDSEIDHLRQLRRTNEAIIKELRQLLTYALSKK